MHQAIRGAFHLSEMDDQTTGFLYSSKWNTIKMVCIMMKELMHPLYFVNRMV